MFTRLACFGDVNDLFYHSPINRIGTYYSPASEYAAGKLFEEFGEKASNRLTGKSSTWRSQQKGERVPSPDSPLSASSAKEAAVPAARSEEEMREAQREAVARYFYYIHHGIDEDLVVPAKDQWLDQILTMIPQEPPRLMTENFFHDFVDDCVREVNEDYVFSVRKAMVDYVMSSRIERERLMLGDLETPIGRVLEEAKSKRDELIWRELPDGWFFLVDTARESIAWTLQTLSPNALLLSSLWEEFSATTLSDTSSEDFQQGLPYTAQDFLTVQTERCEKVKEALWSSWVPRSAEIFRLVPPICINGDSDSYYSSITTLQSNQLHTLIQDSLDEYVRYFEQHIAVDQLDPFSSELLWSVEGAFTISMSFVSSSPVFEPSFHDIERIVSQVMDQFVMSVSGIPRLGSNMSTGGRRVVHVPSVDLNDFNVLEARKRVLAVLQANTVAPKRLMALFDDYLYIMTMDVEQYLVEFLAAKHPLEDYEEAIQKYRAAGEAIMGTCVDNVRTGMYILECKEFKQTLADAAEKVALGLLHQIRQRVQDSNRSICESYSGMSAEIGKVSGTTEEVLDLKAYMQKSKADQENLQEMIKENQEMEDFLHQHMFPVPESDFTLAVRAYEWPKKMLDIMKEAVAKVNKEHRAFEDALKKRRAAFSQLLMKYEEEIEQFKEWKEIVRRTDYSSAAEDMSKRLGQAEEEAEEINRLERLFGWPATKFEKVTNLNNMLSPFLILWTTVYQFYSSYATWMNGPFSKLDPEEVDSDAMDMFRKIYKLSKLFSGATGQDPLENPLSVAQKTVEKIKGFQEHISLLSAICNMGLRPRHWAKLSEAVGFEFKRDDHTSLNRLIDRKIVEHKEQIQEISDNASREWTLEKTLDKMESDWADLSFELNEWKDTGTFILKGGPVDEAQTLLDDHIIKSQSMSASPFAQPFADRIGPWEKKLVLLQDILDEWLKCQSKWIYLEPIFGSEEIMKQIPKEGTAFREMDTIWREIMQNVNKTPHILTVADFSGLLEQLKDANSQLEIVEKGLNAFLDTKKMAFPRFFFLSNDELLEILSEGKIPTNVQPFVKKCFESMRDLHFNDNGLIEAMNSQEGEQVPFPTPVDPAASGAVEVWLDSVEAQMRQALLKVSGDAIEAYSSTPRDKWIFDWPGQLVLNCSQVFWTSETTEAIQTGGSKGLGEYADKCTAQLMQLVNAVRGDLTKLNRQTCGALVVIDVHARDVVADMAKSGVEDDSDFKWLSQLRYYWEYDDMRWKQDTLVVRMINAVAYYGYEYYGNSGRLVITPLTDRCYRTLMGAIHLNLGGAPAGPAGTGKTETTKDLAKALAIQCVVFNCSDSLDYKAMGKFFKGLACSGAWACFDEFNRIDLEVLSVVAQQVLTIQRAVAANAMTFMFEGLEIRLVNTCNVFITMNPGYAGRSELPDNLKALFRDVAMMVPDYALIAEIILYSNGYLEARPMARKLVQTYRLCSEQLSSQDHYDYGMRAVIAVLRAAANLKQKYTTEKEDVLMLRAILDVNVPKFLDQDVPLFNGILSDLFPGVELPPIDYDAFKSALTDNCKKMNLQPLDSFFVKITQLYEMIIVRHGLMVVGESFGMKTSAYKVLAAALGDLCDKGLMNEKKVAYYVLNPKSVTMGQLYGMEDPVSKEWSDGILAVSFRNAARDTRDIRKWIMLDGPVDAIWIENMNTVLDDNKKLCLNSGEIVAMSGLMNMIFEVQDLAVASPATVSRCGMVYVQESLLGWEAPVQSWITTLPDGLTQEHRDHIMALCSWLIPPCLRVVSKMCKMPLTAQSTNLVCSFMRLYESLLDEFHHPEKIAEMNENLVMCWVQCIFLFSLVWSVGACTDSAGREVFDKMLRKILINDAPKDLQIFITAPSVKLTQLFPEGKDVFGYTFDKGKGKWQPWLDTVEAQQLSPDMEFTNILVQTTDTVRYTFLLDAIITHGHHTLFVGPTGTGKSAYIKQHLQNGLDREKYTFSLMNFSAQTSVNMTQDIVDGKLDKRRKGVFGPPIGKRMMILVDDVNMPQVETYGAQPPIELLRQWMDHGGWYDRKELTFRQLVDIQFVAAMGPPGGGRNGITNRYARHFSLFSITEFDDESLGLIFNSLMQWWHKKFDLPESLGKRIPQMVKASIETYRSVQTDLLPTPAKTHYTFNLRDISKVFQGIVSAGKQVQEPGEMMRLWAHETMRVYHDRLINDDDREYLTALCVRVVENQLKEKFSKVMTRTLDDQKVSLDEDGLNRLSFGDFMVPGADPRFYREVPDEEKFLNVVNDYLADHNAVSKKPLNLVMFGYALSHVSRICRIVNLPGGHALLVGLGGSGRQSLARLAAFMEEYEVFQIELSKTYSKVEWADDLRKVLRMAGELNKRVLFLLSDVQIKWEGMVEDVSNLLNTYEVPNLISASDFAAIFETIRPRAKAAGMDKTKQDLSSFFLQEVKKNFHIVLTMSPVSNSFRERLRMFPALVNCCTIDWFSGWPREALASVAEDSFKDLPVDPGMKENLIKSCVYFHATAMELAERFKTEARRIYYVTPTSYLELLSSYKSLLSNRQDVVAQQKKRYEVGLQKLLDTEQSVQGMQAELIELQPKLVESTKETEQAMEIIAKETVEADKVKAVVEVDEKKASEEAAAVKAIKDECESDLAEAMPMLEAALKALDTLTKADITEVKNMKSPPSAVKLVMEAVCIIRGRKAARVKDANSGKMVDDFWETAKKMLMESNFLQQLREFDKDNIPASIVTKIRTYVENPDFDPAKIKQASNAAYGLCCWVRAMEAYDRVAKVVGPKKISLAKAESELEVVMSALAVKQAELKEVLDKLAALDADLQGKKAKKEQLEADVEMCTVKLDRAQKLISGLGGEKTRWSACAEELGEEYEKLTGDVVLSAAQVAYLGAFTQNYRDSAIKSWVEKCRELNIPCSDNFSLTAVLGDPVKIRTWNIQGLPKDEFSTQNAIALDQKLRFPLCIDPQGLANNWFRTMEAKNELKVVKLTDPTYLRTLENAIQFGHAVLIENVMESVDATLEPLLQKEIFRQGGANCIRLGDAVVEYSDDFKLYMTSKLRNPHYPPEICVKVQLLNFMTTPEGLEDQLLGIVVAKERPDLEEEKNKLIVQGAENKRKLKEIEDEILKTLSASEGNILEDKKAVEILQEAKITSDDITEKQKIADVTEAKIDEARRGYKPVAFHSTCLFFCVADIASIDPMYQYSLAWFTALFIRSISDSPKSPDLSARLKSLADHFTYFLYVMVCRSLFEKDKLLFAFHLSTKLAIANGKLTNSQLRFLLTGGVVVGDLDKENPAPEWISPKMWTEMCLLSDIEGLKGLADHVSANPESWRAIYDSPEPQSLDLPEPWADSLDAFQQLMVLRTIRLDKVIPGITQYTEGSMGKKFVEPLPVALEPSYNESDCCTPLLFILSPGSDPMTALLKFADDRNMRIEVVSLGQGQGPVAKKWIDSGSKDGYWFVLQNCHLAKSFLPDLERICETQLVPGVHKDFRLWLTSYPSPIFPISILENCVKMTSEAPKGLRAGMLRTYTSDPVSDSEFFNSCSKDSAWRKMMFGLGFFHSVLQERRKFGAIGFNIGYQFNENDLRISVRQLKMFLDEYEEIPYETLKYTCGECNYGGKVTDGHDRNTLMTLLDVYYTSDILNDKYKLSPSGKYAVPPQGSHKSYLDAIYAIPLITSPEVFGLHENATITKDLKETDEMLGSLMLTQSSEGGGGGDSAESVVESVAEDIRTRWPGDFDIEAAMRKYPQDYHNSMNTVLTQELGRYNNLLVLVRNSLVNLGKALKGLALMNNELETVFRCVYDGKIPPPWLKKSFPSLKPLSGYVKETIDRCQFLQGWVDDGQPKLFWLPGFFFTQAFLTGSKQNFARKYTIEIDKVDFDFFVKDDLEEAPQEAPDDGVLVNGMFIEGCAWDSDKHVLCESDPKVLFTNFPTIHMCPMDVANVSSAETYSCPVYKTPDRRGILSTTGHSTNFVLDTAIPIDKDAAHWTKRGVALLLSLME